MFNLFIVTTVLWIKNSPATHHNKFFHLMELNHKSSTLLPWRWRQQVPPKRCTYLPNHTASSYSLYLQQPDSRTSPTRAPRSRRANDVGWFVRPAIRNCVAQWIVFVSSLKQHGLRFSQSGHELHSSHVLSCILLPVYGHAITQAYILCSPQVPGNLFASQLITYSNAETNNWYTKFLASLNTSSYGSMPFTFKTNVNVELLNYYTSHCTYTKFIKFKH